MQINHNSSIAKTNYFLVFIPRIDTIYLIELMYSGISYSLRSTQSWGQSRQHEGSTDARFSPMLLCWDSGHISSSRFRRWGHCTDRHWWWSKGISFLKGPLQPLKNVRFLEQAQKTFESAVFDGVPGPLHWARHTWQCPCFSQVPETTIEAKLRALQGCNTKMN